MEPLPTEGSFRAPEAMLCPLTEIVLGPDSWKWGLHTFSRGKSITPRAQNNFSN